MKLIRYYGKARNFNSIGCVKKRENSDKNSFFNLCNAAFTMIFFTLGMAPQSISSQYYGKTAFFLSGTFGWNGSNTFQRKIITTKHGCFFYENRHGEHFLGAIALSYPPRVRATVKFSAAFFQEESSITIGGVRKCNSTTFFTLTWNSKQVSKLIEAVVRSVL